jgi:hypothetical protein
VDEKRTAERHIQNLCQTGSVIEYTSKFQQIFSRLK